MTNDANHWSKKRFHWFNPKIVGLVISVASALALFWVSNKQGIEELIGLAGCVLLGTHMFLTPSYYGAELDKVERERHLDANAYLKLMAGFLFALYIVAEFLI
ncbi:MAG: hypothetical protein AB8B96_15015 [Lysobacterales bacterium]